MAVEFPGTTEVITTLKSLKDRLVFMITLWLTNFTTEIGVHDPFENAPYTATVAAFPSTWNVRGTTGTGSASCTHSPPEEPTPAVPLYDPVES